MMAKNDTFVEFVCDQLDGLDAITYKSMFGGYGIYCGAVFFAIAYRGVLYFKTNERTRPRYEAWESGAFQPNAKQTLSSYYEVPVEVIEDVPQFVALAEEAVQVAEGL